MNKTVVQVFFILLSLLYFTSCSKTPVADFSYTPLNPVAGENVKFTNKSINAKSYSWNFGNAAIGKDENPTHIYEQSGTFTIDLSAFNGLKSDMKTTTITIGN